MDRILKLFQDKIESEQTKQELIKKQRIELFKQIHLEPYSEFVGSLNGVFEETSIFAVLEHGPERLKMTLKEAGYITPFIKFETNLAAPIDFKNDEQIKEGDSPYILERCDPNSVLHRAQQNSPFAALKIMIDVLNIFVQEKELSEEKQEQMVQALDRLEKQIKGNIDSHLEFQRLLETQKEQGNRDALWRKLRVD